MRDEYIPHQNAGRSGRADLFTKAVLTLIVVLLAQATFARFNVPVAHAQGSWRYSVAEVTCRVTGKNYVANLEKAINGAANGRELVALVETSDPGRFCEYAAIFKEQAR